MKSDKSMIKEIKKRYYHDVKVIENGEKFNFKCQACGMCCFAKEISLEIIDVIRLRHALHKATHELFKEKLIGLHIGGESGLPICTIKMDMIGPKGKEFSKCPFLAPAIEIHGEEDFKAMMYEVKKETERLGGTSKKNIKEVIGKILQKRRINRYMCAIHPDRPTFCRLWPLGRGHRYNKDGVYEKTTYFIVGDKCPGVEAKNNEITIEDWLKQQELDKYGKVTHDWMNLITRLCKVGLTKKKQKDVIYKTPIDDRMLGMLAAMMYNFDGAVPFEKDKRVQKTIHDKDVLFDDYLYVHDKVLDNVNTLADAFESFGKKDKKGVIEAFSKFERLAKGED